MQSIGQLDEDDADVLHHRQHHLAEVFRLRLGLGLELDMGQLADPVDQFSHLRAEQLYQLLLGSLGIFDNIVEDSSNNALMVESHLGEDAGDSKGVIDVGFAAQAALPLVGLGTEQVGAIDLLDLFGLEILFEHGAEIANQEHASLLHVGMMRLTELPADFRLAHDRLDRLSRCNFIEDFTSDMTLGDLAQSHHRGLVILQLNQGFTTIGKLAGTLGGNQYQLETIVDVIQAIFDSNTRHFLTPMR